MPLRYNNRKVKLLTHRLFWCCCFFNVIPTFLLADEMDTLNFSFSTTKTFDNNQFRRPSNEVSDQATINRLGVNFDKAISLQKFHADMNVTDSKYNKSDFLDFTAKQYSLGWNWAITPSLTGLIQTKQEERLNDFRFVTAPVRNIVSIKTHSFEADFSPHKILHLLAGVTVLETENDNAFIFDQQEEISNKTNRYNVGVRYDFADAYLEGMYRKSNTQPSNSIPDFVRWIDTKSDSDNYGLTFETRADSKFNYKVHLGYVQKESPIFTQRNYSGIVGDLSTTYEVTSKIMLNGSAGRSIRSFIRADSSYAEIDTVKLGLRYSIFPKLSVVANTSYLIRRFLGDGPSGNGSREDHEASAMTGVYWNPRDFINASVTLNKSKRNSTDNFFDYDDTSAFVTVGLVF